MDFCDRGWKKSKLKELKDLLNASHRGLEQQQTFYKDGWTEEEENQLYKMITSGFPLKVCAQTLNKSNNAVYGKVWRKGWRKKEDREVFKALRKQFSQKLKNKKASKEIIQPVIFDQTGAPIPKNKDLLSLEDNECRYVVEDISYKFCANETVKGTSYCQFHLSKCYHLRNSKKISLETQDNLEVAYEV